MSLFAVAQLERHGHEGLSDLAPPGAKPLRVFVKK
jgi:hypothetical protein